MSMIQLLTVSQSLKESIDRTGKFKDGPCLPRFESTPRLAPAASPFQPKPAGQGSLFSELVADPDPAPAPIPVVHAPPVYPAAPKLAPATPSARTSIHSGPLFPTARRKDNTWKSMMKEMFFGRARRRPMTVSVQTELALEKVTVIRNDLSDVELDVVPRRGRTMIAKVTPPLALERRQDRPWSRMASKLFPFKKIPKHPFADPALGATSNKTPELIAHK